jgi:Secretion system C-terminal sorting domain
MYWDDYNNPGINNPADLKVAHLKTGQWRNEGTNASGTTSSGSVTSNVLNTWSPFTLGQVKATIPLSIVINNFNVVKTDIANLISWQTNSENNNDFFTIQKSADGINFTNLGDVKSKAANGNSSTLINYGFNDAQPFVGANYYRLTQTDFNGTSKISSNVKVVYWNNAAHVSVYPNPVVNNLNINYTAAANGAVEMRLYDALGKLVASKTVYAVQGANAYSLDMERLASGVYQLEVRDGKESGVWRVVK